MEKEDLEKRKLELEIKKLNRKWYKDLDFWKVTIPTLAILISLYFTFGRGLLDSEKSKLELQKEQLKLDIAKFEIQRDELAENIQLKDSVRISLEKQIQEYMAQKQTLVNRILLLNKSLKETSSEHMLDKTFYQNELKEQYNLEKTRLTELNRLQGINNDKDISIAVLEAELKFLNSKVNLSNIEKNELEILKSEASIKIAEKQANEYQKSIDRLKEKFDNEKKKIDNMSNEDILRYFEINLLKMEADQNK